jgi:hypothetical protein
MDRDLEHLRRQARYWRERRDLYRAKSYGPRVTSPTRMRELEASTQLAEARLKHAERPAPDAADPS